MVDVFRIMVLIIVNAILVIMEVNANVSFQKIRRNVFCHMITRKFAWYQDLFACLILAWMEVHVNLDLVATFIAIARLNTKGNDVNFVGVFLISMHEYFYLIVLFDWLSGKVCEPNPCRNGGTCNPYGADTYSCNCPFGYTGRDCETRKMSKKKQNYDDV